VRHPRGRWAVGTPDAGPSSPDRPRTDALLSDLFVPQSIPYGVTSAEGAVFFNGRSRLT
jgi:hypothetical protein